MRTLPKDTITHGSGAVFTLYCSVTFMYGGMPGSVLSPYSELAIA